MSMTDEVYSVNKLKTFKTLKFEFEVDSIDTKKLLREYGRGTSPRQDTSSRHPAYKLPFCAQGRNNLRAGLSTIAQQAQRFDLPLRNEVKTGKKLLKIVCFLQLNFLIFVILPIFPTMRRRKHAHV